MAHLFLITGGRRIKSRRFMRFLSADLLKTTLLVLMIMLTAKVSWGADDDSNSWRRSIELEDISLLGVANKLNSDQYAVLPPDMQRKYIELLRSREWVLVEGDIAREIAERIPLAIPEKQYHYLVRGLTLEMGTGAYTIYFSDGRLAVLYGALGHRPPRQPKQDVLLISLPGRIEKLFVNYYVAD
jgi:hypothetical protein